MIQPYSQKPEAERKVTIDRERQRRYSELHPMLRLFALGQLGTLSARISTYHVFSRAMSTDQDAMYSEPPPQQPPNPLIYLDQGAILVEDADEEVTSQNLLDRGEKRLT